ncbi:hypothetical protein SEVIR_9G261700v4 [Setaria viridis]|uniref:Dof-type domain-containing protein n=1 Tax=Setaria viridis TaxID=4556 RepID=A0A4U6T239_SETVI|nr:cyclic dof factor 1-like [Setaria viridis]TKV93922.1 hypothetical protein SEVIR_9G261700v2 [Setaria viridis]
MMAECRGGDCLIKLFGKTIPVPEAADAAKESGSSSSSTESDAPENAHQEASDPSPQPEVVDAEDPKSSPETTQQPDAAGDVASQREKLKKPDKVLPCPRCNSMDTKFCYFNNYNVNQPRHFCKNCQRYWTAGGAMRNVPVGAGRRKNKHAVAASHFLQRVRAALPAAGDPLKTNGTVLNFGGHGPPPALHDLTEQVNHLQEKLLIPARKTSNPSPAVGPCSEGSSSTDDMTHGGGIKEKSSTVDKPANGAQYPAGMNGAAVWPYSCAPPPAYFSSGIAIPIYPAAPGYWGCMVPGAWSLPWSVQPPSQGLSSPSSAPSVSSSGPDSLTLGKHPREVDEGRSSAHGSGKVWAPKTIRIDDADEVARSSIWSLIGIKGDKKRDDADHAVGHKHGTVFEPKLEVNKAAKPGMITRSPFLHTNPVALTRSVTFQEGS